MGSGAWDSNVYRTAATTRATTGVDDFDYDRKVKSGLVSGIHASLDPKLMNGGVRESRDSDEHPESLPIAVIFDVTGSMGGIPRVLQQKLVRLMDVIKDKANIVDPQILVGAVGDATCDRYPFQVGQFESDNRFDEQLRAIILEGNGGGQMYESYGLAFKFAADCTEIDSYEKRGKKGYFFTIGDEMPWDPVRADEVAEVFGLTAVEDERIESVIARAQEKWEIFHYFPLDSGYGKETRTHERWKRLLGERLLFIEDSSLICEAIAAQVHVMETASSIDKVLDDIGIKGHARNIVGNAVVPYKAGGLVKGSSSNLPTRKAGDRMKRV